MPKAYLTITTPPIHWTQHCVSEGNLAKPNQDFFSLSARLSFLSCAAFSLQGTAAQRETEQRKPRMAMNFKVSFGLIAVFAVVFTLVLPSVHGHEHYTFAPAPAPTSDGTTIDQGIACALMLLALVLTYLIHAFDAPLNI